MNKSLKHLTPIQRRKWIISMVNKRVKPGCGSSIELLKSRTWTQPTPDLNNIIKQTPYFKDLADLSRMLGGANDSELDEIRKTVKLYYAEALEDLEQILWAGRLEYYTD